MTYYTRELKSNKLRAMVSARTYSEALLKTAGNYWSSKCFHKASSSDCPTLPEGVPVNCITFIYNDEVFYMYHF